MGPMWAHMNPKWAHMDPKWTKNRPKIGAENLALHAKLAQYVCLANLAWLAWQVACESGPVHLTLHTWSNKPIEPP